MRETGGVELDDICSHFFGRRTPVNTDDGEDPDFLGKFVSAECLFEETLSVEIGQDIVSEINAECLAFSAGEMREIEYEFELLEE